MTDKQPEALRLAELLELAPEDGVEPQTTEDAAAELRRQHTRIAELEARIKTMAEEHADELMVAHLDGRMRAAQPAGAQQGVAYAALSDAEIDRIVPALESVSEDFPAEWAVWKDRERIRKELRASHWQAPAQAAPAAVGHDEDLLEKLYWEFDSQRKKTGEERLAFKVKMRFYASEFLRRSNGKMTFAQSVSDDMMNLADRLGSEFDDVDPRAWKHLLVYAPKAAPAAVAVPTFEDFCKRHGLDPKKMEGHGGMWARVALDECRATTQPAPQQEARPVTPYTCPKCHALWLHWPAEQSGFGVDTLNCRSATHCDYCEKGGVEQLERLERVPAALKAPQQEAQEPVGYTHASWIAEAKRGGGGSFVGRKNAAFDVPIYTAPQPSPTPKADSQPAPAAVAGPSETHEAMCPALTGGRCTCERNDPAVDKAWARFCGGIGDGPDAPYPGMISAFERYYSQSFTDKDWRNEASVWAAAWKQALLTASAPTTQPAPQQEASPTTGMNIAQRILHVGGRNNAAGYVEFGSIQAVEALVRQVLRDLPAAPQPSPASQGDALDAARLDWLLLHISGAEFRRIGVHYSGNASRADVDAARKQGANHD